VAPSAETARDGSYRPLSRAVFIYVSLPALQARPEVAEFVEFYLDHAAQLVDEVGFIPLPTPAYAKLREHFSRRRLGSLYAGQAQFGARVEDLLLKPGQ
jgi:phosphate transport system substrate-binding protein